MATLPTHKVIHIASGTEMIINQSDYDENEHELVDAPRVRRTKKADEEVAESGEETPAKKGIATKKK